jgi:hypothetical protein
MTVFRNENSWDTSNVEFDGRSIRDYSKRNCSPQMSHIDWGLGLFRDTAFDGWPDAAPIDLADVYSQLVKMGKLAAVEVNTRFYEIGSAEGIRETDALIRSQRK